MFWKSIEMEMISIVKCHQDFEIFKKLINWNWETPFDWPEKYLDVLARYLQVLWLQVQVQVQVLNFHKQRVQVQVQVQSTWYLSPSTKSKYST